MLRTGSSQRLQLPRPRPLHNALPPCGGSDGAAGSPGHVDVHVAVAADAGARRDGRGSLP